MTSSYPASARYFQGNRDGLARRAVFRATVRAPHERGYRDNLAVPSFHSENFLSEKTVRALIACIRVKEMLGAPAAGFTRYREE